MEVEVKNIFTLDSSSTFDQQHQKIYGDACWEITGAIFDHEKRHCYSIDDKYPESE